VDKLVRTGSRWLAGHPESELISRRYLSHRRELVRTAVGRLAEVDDTEPEALDNAVPATDDDATTAVEVEVGVDPAPAQERVPLVRMRHEAVLAALREVGARRVVDLGCGPGSLLRHLLADPVFTEIVGVDVSVRALEQAARKLRLDRLPERRRGRLQLLQSSLMYTDGQLTGYDAVVLMEVIEHVEAARLPALEHSVFGAARPAAVVVTTPNAEYNVRYETLPAGSFRHPDHRFEWTREQFRTWAGRVAATHGYLLTVRGVGPEDDEVGTPTQLALFRRADLTDRTGTTDRTDTTDRTEGAA
jgi:3' terminal RNA ribose 2'-O-methyltransferase Hen1